MSTLVTSMLVADEVESGHTPAAGDVRNTQFQNLIWRELRTVKDPEIPVLDVVEMGIVRAVEVALADVPEGAPEVAATGASEDLSEPTVDAVIWRATVTITPTFSACPALHEIERDVRETTEALLSGLIGAGELAEVEVVTTLSPPWSSDDMTAAARDKLERFGIAPAPPHGGLLMPALEAPVRCPRCGYPDTRVRNAFGSTLCREIRSCNSCQETFERFKPI